MSGVGKTTAARALARRFDLRLYSLDLRTYEHAAQLPQETRSLDELWVDSTPDELADRFEAEARLRFPCVLADLAALPDDALVIADGPQLLPELVMPLAASDRHALFVVARADLQPGLVRARGSSLYGRTRDPQRALDNRLKRDALLSERVRRSNGVVVEVESVEETLDVLERHFAPFLAPAGGDVVARRRDENDARLRQVRAHVNATSADPMRPLELECECGTPGCQEILKLSLAAAEESRRASRQLIGH
jgi:hypothetical protein